MSETTTRAEPMGATGDAHALERRVLVLAPFGRDAAEVCRVLGEADFETERCGDGERLCAEIARGAAAALVAQEALSDEDWCRLAAVLAEQPAWSDLPLLLMTSQVRGDDDAWHLLRGIEGTGHITLLERPLRVPTVVSAVGTALGSRRRQYEVRDELAARRRAEEEVRRVASFPQEAPNPVLRVHPGGQLLFANAAGLKMLQALGCDADQPVPRSLLDLVAAAAAHHGPVEAEVEVEPGQTFLFSAARPPGQEYVNLYGYNITGRKQLEQTLRQRELDLSRAQAVGQLGNWRLDVRRNVLTWSEQNHRMFGIPVGTPLSYEVFLGTVHPDDRRYVDTMWKAALRGEPYDIEHRIVVAGATRWVRERAYLEFDESGTLLGGFGITQDITDRKQTEEALRHLTETLEQQVAERTAVAERRARDLRRLAAELSEAEHRERTRLAKLLHDDLQQLLLGAKLRLPVLVEGSREEIEQHVERLDELLGECLSAARNLTQELSPPVLQVGTLPEVIEWLGQWFAERHGLSVAADIQRELPPTPAHLRVFLFQALRELLFNVVKHSGRREARVGLSSQDAYFRVEVEDAGHGFDPEAVQRQLREPAGFGLFHIRERLEALGGRLEIQRAPQGGARFGIVVPLAEAAEPRLGDAEPQGAAAPKGSSAKSRTGGQRIRGTAADRLPY